MKNMKLAHFLGAIESMPSISLRVRSEYHFLPSQKRVSIVLRCNSSSTHNPDSIEALFAAITGQGNTANIVMALDDSLQKQLGIENTQEYDDQLIPDKYKSIIDHAIVYSKAMDEGGEKGCSLWLGAGDEN